MIYIFGIAVVMSCAIFLTKTYAELQEIKRESARLERDKEFINGLMELVSKERDVIKNIEEILDIMEDEDAHAD